MRCVMSKFELINVVMPLREFRTGCGRLVVQPNSNLFCDTEIGGGGVKHHI